MSSFLVALQFLTIIPVTHSLNVSDKQLGTSPLFYPVIGLIIGVLLILLSTLLINMPLLVQTILILIVWVLITGGLHLDGLADCADAWVGGLGNSHRSLEIMKDPAAGPIAVIVLVLMLLLKASCIYSIIDTQQLTILLITPCLGRISILILMISTPYIRKNGLGEKILLHASKHHLKIVSLLGLISSLFFVGVIPIMLMLATLFVIRFQAKKRLGGMTGDVYGASVELSEVSILLGMMI